ncbi:hypothetical protein MCGE09_00612 [Thaumarchaeota archaeon SCGC AB-539-E09]|nr:hypothetical protein MCGE09_00612 [Thaumarchaeota archaeon SCGC AB-539-E09]
MITKEEGFTRKELQEIMERERVSRLPEGL